MSDTNTNQPIKIPTQSIPTHDHCTTCIWLDRQPEGNRMLCIMPGACEWSMDGLDSLHTIDTKDSK